MPAGLLPRLGARVTFVVGKGGVGKTTLAGALALALADDGRPAHLLSTDPAHSLGDLFGRPVGPDPGPSPCGDRLVLEELDARRLVEGRMRELTPGLRELIERGTYLDEEDADSLLTAALPGLDEMGAALRIAELAEARLVVDTAPTGHMLRLLDTPTMVRSWLDVFDAMADKADTVASALVGGNVRMEVESRLAELAGDMDVFESTVRSADFVVVGGAGDVVAAETDRLAATLADRGLRVAATVSRAGERAPDILVPALSGLAGCEALRAWRDEWRATADGVEGEPAGVPEADGAEMEGPVGVTESPFRGALDRPLVVFAGKGGVGKSTCAAAAAARLAEEGPVVLFGADPAGSLADVLGGDAVPGLEVRELDAAAELDRFKARFERDVEAAFESIGLDRAAALDRAVIESLWQLAPPGVDELMAVSRLSEEVGREARIVVDSAPTGHFLRLVAMPGIALDWLRRTMRIVLKYGAMGELDAPAEHLLRFAQRFRALQERLLAPDRTAVVVVTLDEPMVLAETRRLLAELRRLELPLGGVLINRARESVHALDDERTWRAPEVREPRGADALRDFTHSWRRVK